MARNYFTEINMNSSAIRNFLADPLAAAPATHVAGQVYYNTTTNTFERSDGTRFEAALTHANGVGPVSTDVSTTRGTLSITVAEANAGSAGLLSASGFTLLNAATGAATADTLALRDASGNLNVATPTASSHAATKGYVDALTAAGMHIVGGIDASANPDYPGATAGEAYKVTVAGLVGGASGVQVEEGDVVLALNTAATGDQATVGTDWLVLQSNIDYATDAVGGYVKLASAADLTAGTSTTAVITVADLVANSAALTANFSTQLGALQSQVSSNSGSISSLGGQIGSINGQLSALNGQLSSLSGQLNSINSQVAVNTGAIATVASDLQQLPSLLTHAEVLVSGQNSWSVAHNIGGLVQVEVMLESTGETVVTDVTRIDLNNLTISTAADPGVNLVVMVNYSGYIAPPAAPMV